MLTFVLLTWLCLLFFFFFSSRRRHTRFDCDWSSDVCSSDLCRQLGDARPHSSEQIGVRGGPNEGVKLRPIAAHEAHAGHEDVVDQPAVLTAVHAILHGPWTPLSALDFRDDAGDVFVLTLGDEPHVLTGL